MKQILLFFLEQHKKKKKSLKQLEASSKSGESTALSRWVEGAHTFQNADWVGTCVQLNPRSIPMQEQCSKMLQIHFSLCKLHIYANKLHTNG